MYIYPIFSKKNRTKGVLTKCVPALLLVSGMLLLSACGKGGEDGADAGTRPGSDAFLSAIDEIRQDEDLGSHIGASEEKLGGINFTILDSSTIKASINDPYIIARATEMTHVQLKLFPDIESRDRREGAFAFDMQFVPDENGALGCNVYPQTCRIEPNGEGASIVDETIPDENGAPLCGAASVADTMITFVVQYAGLSDIIKANPVYATYVDYEEYTKGEIDSIILPENVVPDLSNTTLKDAVDLSMIKDVYPSYIVLEEDFDPYISYSGHSFMPGVGSYEGQIFWAATSNDENTRKALLVVSMDEFGVANYNMAVVYDSHGDLMRDYVADDEINMTESFGFTDMDSAEITDEMTTVFLPENGSDYWGAWNYTVSGNVIYWHFTPDFYFHYKLRENDGIPDVTFQFAGFNNYDLTMRLTALVKEILEKGEAEGTYEYGYTYDKMSAEAKNSTPATGSVSYKGYYHKAPLTDAASGGSNAEYEDKIREKALQIREELQQKADAEVEAILNSDATVDPAARAEIYDPDSADILLMGLDMDLLASGGSYEIDFDDYTIRVSADSADSPHASIGKYNGEQFEELKEVPCDRDLNSGTPNFLRVNANLSDISEISWTQAGVFTLYQSDDRNAPGSSRKKIDREVIVNRY